MYTEAYDAFSLLLTAWACVNLALEEPWLLSCAATGARGASPACATHGAALLAYLQPADAAVAGLLLGECVLKAFCQGLWGPPGSPAYLRSPWHAVDVGVAVAGLGALGVGWGGEGGLAGPALRAVRAIRALRALRGLRFFRATALASIIDTLGAMLPALGSSLLLVLLFMYIFAVIGLQSFMGAMNLCNDSVMSQAGACVGEFVVAGPNCAFLPTLQLEAACKAMGEASNFTMPRIYEPLLREWGWGGGGRCCCARTRRRAHGTRKAHAHTHALARTLHTHHMLVPSPIPLPLPSPSLPSLSLSLSSHTRARLPSSLSGSQLGRLSYVNLPPAMLAPPARPAAPPAPPHCPLPR